MSGLRSRRRQMSCCVSPLELHGWGSQLWNAAFHSTTSQTPRSWLSYHTMNTADRSIALVDHALRRRFSFIHLGPDYDVLRDQLKKYGLTSDGLVNALRAVNAAIEDRNYEVGISFFLKDGANLRSKLRDIWEGEIEPYLEEYFYDQPGKLEPLRWKKLASGPLASWATEQ